jgi:hypothetical protein
MQMNRLLRYAAIGSLALIIGGASMQARASAAGDPWKSDELSAKKDGRGGGKHAGKPGGGKHGGGGGRHHAGGRHDGGRHHGGRHDGRHHGRNVNVHVNRNVRVVARPVKVWAPRPYYGRVVGGVALGTIVAATVIGSAPVAPAPNMCWYWADPSQSRGYWDYCVAP